MLRLSFAVSCWNCKLKPSFTLTCKLCMCPKRVGVVLNPWLGRDVTPRVLDTCLVYEETLASSVTCELLKSSSMWFLGNKVLFTCRKSGKTQGWGRGSDIPRARWSFALMWIASSYRSVCFQKSDARWIWESRQPTRRVAPIWFYKITKIVRAFWFAKNLWFIVPVNS